MQKTLFDTLESFQPQYINGRSKKQHLVVISQCDSSAFTFRLHAQALETFNPTYPFCERQHFNVTTQGISQEMVT